MNPPKGAALDRLYEVLQRHGIARDYSLQVEADAADVVQNAAIDDPSLVDLTDVPFVTIDGEGARDLDQALHLAVPDKGGAARYRFRYALADAAHFVRPGRPLYAEAMRRGVTYYLPSLAVPMLPRALSEGIVSLNPGVDRRALVMDIMLDGAGRVLRTELVRARIRSRRQLTYDQVQAFVDGPADHTLSGHDFSESLALIKTVGQLRILLADERDVVRYNRLEVTSGIDPADPDRFIVAARVRNDVERWNEQLSLLSNAEGARFMVEAGRAPHITPIYRVHPKPLQARRAELRTLTEHVARAHGLASWVWRSDEPLADYIARLPTGGQNDRVAAALQRQAIMINRRSVFSAEPGPHHGVGLEPYARFTSPMREMVGIFTHKEAFEKLTGTPTDGWPAARTRSSKDGPAPRQEQAQMVEVANRSRTVQQRVAKAADLLILDQILQEDLQTPPASRPRRRGTIMGITRKKIYVQFDAPPFEVKVRLSDLSAAARVSLRADDVGATIVDPSGAVRYRLGDGVVLMVDRRENRRYVFVDASGGR